MCVKTMVFTSPNRLENDAATGKEKAERTPDQKKNRLATGAAKLRGLLQRGGNTLQNCGRHPGKVNKNSANASILRHNGSVRF